MKLETGGKGKSFNDRELAAKVRTLCLDLSKEALSGKGLGKDKEFRKALLLKFAGTLLPRLNELSGIGGGAISLAVLFEAVKEKNETE